jgi:hypothetical protein
LWNIYSIFDVFGMVLWNIESGKREFEIWILHSQFVWCHDIGFGFVGFVFLLSHLYVFIPQYAFSMRFVNHCVVADFWQVLYCHKIDSYTEQLTRTTTRGFIWISFFSNSSTSILIIITKIQIYLHQSPQPSRSPQNISPRKINLIIFANLIEFHSLFPLMLISLTLLTSTFIHLIQIYWVIFRNLSRCDARCFPQWC